jgi:hypothetical protein
MNVDEPKVILHDVTDIMASLYHCIAKTCKFKL